MISQSYIEAKDEICGVFKAAWDTTGYRVVWPNQAGEVVDQTTTPPIGQEPWARFSITHGVGEETIGRIGGKRRYCRMGQVVVQIHAPAGASMNKSYALAKLVTDAFEGYVTGSGVWFRNARIKEMGTEGNTFQTNVFVDFEYDEVK